MKQEDSKKRQVKSALEKAENLSKMCNTKMQELKKAEGQWRWQLHKERRQLDVEKEKILARKSEVQLAVKKINRKQVALTKGSSGNCNC
jgi:hypothetical protein